MSTETATRPADADAPEADGHDGAHHPRDRDYVVLAVILAVITAAEIATDWWEGASTLGLVLVLFPMMIAKFVIVVGWFMHLKYDNPLFTRVFVFGLILAIAVYGIMFATFEYWSDDYFKFLKA